MIMERFYNGEPIYDIFNILHLCLWDKSVSADLVFLGRSVLLVDLIVAELWAYVKRCCLAGKPFTQGKFSVKECSFFAGIYKAL